MEDIEQQKEQGEEGCYGPSLFSIRWKMSKSILQNLQTNYKKETDNLKDKPAPHCGESPVPASSLSAVAVLRPSLLGMMMTMMMVMMLMMMIMMMMMMMRMLIMMMCLIITSMIMAIDDDYCLLELPGLCSQSIRPRKQTPDIYLITTRSQISQRKKAKK